MTLPSHCSSLDAEIHSAVAIMITYGLRPHSFLLYFWQCVTNATRFRQAHAATENSFFYTKVYVVNLLGEPLCVRTR